MKPGFLNGHRFGPTNSQPDAGSQERASQTRVDQRSRDLHWWKRLFMVTAGDMRDEHELSSIITRLLALKGFHKEWRTEDLPLVLSTVSQLEADQLPREVRLDSQLARDRFSLFIWHEQAAAGLPFLAGCNWCGLPTGNFCDCDSQTSICTLCEKKVNGCRHCVEDHRSKSE